MLKNGALQARTTREHDAKNVLLTLVDVAGLTQEEIAREVGVSVRSVSRWCTGHAVPSARHLKKLFYLAAEDSE